MPYESDVDDDVREALAQALGERKLRINDRRLLVLFLCFVAALVWIGFQQERLDRQQARLNEQSRTLIANCYANRDNTIGFNSFIDKIVATYATSPVLDAEQRKSRIALMAGAKQHVPNCPPER